MRNKKTFILTEQQLAMLSIIPDEMADFSVNTFKPKNELNSKLWEEDKLDSRVRLKLLDIADDFIDTLEIDNLEIEDIYLTGSICNYNWTEFSDIDVHIVVDYSKLYDDENVVKTYFVMKKNTWNDAHDNLMIYGFPVELYVEDLNNPTEASAIYSLEKGEWIKEPKYMDKSLLNIDYIRSQAMKFMEIVDTIAEKLSNESDKVKIEKLNDKLCKLFNKLKKMRKESLKTNKKELSSGNIIWKILKHTGYISIINNIINDNYDRVNSINENRKKY